MYQNTKVERFDVSNLSYRQYTLLKKIKNNIIEPRIFNQNYFRQKTVNYELVTTSGTYGVMKTEIPEMLTTKSFLCMVAWPA